MPKISTNNISVYHKDIRKDYKVEVMYNRQYLFYSIINSEFREIINHLSEDQFKSFHVSKTYDKVSDMRDRPESWKAIVSANTEAECLSRMKSLLNYLVDQTIQQRNVIIVFFTEGEVTRYGYHRHNEKHPALGLQFGLTYAVESTVGDKKVYSTYTEREAFGETRVDRRELVVYHSKCTIIPDTPQNRETLEEIYGALTVLIGKLSEITKSDGNLLEFIDAKIKLLN